MLLKDNKKGLVTIIMKRMQGMSPDTTPSFSKSEKPMKAKQVDGAEQDSSMALESSAKSMMQALKADDASSFAKSLKSFIKMCEECEESLD